MVDTDTTLTETPTWAQVIVDAMDAKLCEVHTCIPAKIESYDSVLGVAEVQPLLKRKFKDGDVVDLPICNQVPVVFPRTAQSYIHLPIKNGDLGLLIFSERSIDRYKNFGGAQDPQDPRKHSLSDGFFIAGGYPITMPPLAVDPNALHLRNSTSEVILKDSGQIDIKNVLGTLTLDQNGKYSLGNNLAELFDVLDRTYARMSTMLDNILALTVPTGVGPSGTPVNSVAFIDDKVDVELLKVDIGLLKL